MLKTVAINLAEGALLVAVVLFLTLGSLRGALIAALAIPLSMGIALVGMVRLGVTGNLMSLGAIDFGLLVDGAIVMLEVALVEIAVRKAQDARGRRLPGRAVDEQGGAAGGVLAAHHHAGLPAADGARGRRGADVQADGDHRRARARRRAAVLADGVPGAGGDVAAAPLGAQARRQQGVLRHARGARYDGFLGACSIGRGPSLAVAAAAPGARHGRRGDVAGRRVRPAAGRGRAVAGHQAAAVDLDHRGAAPGRRGRGGAGAVPRGARRS